MGARNAQEPMDYTPLPVEEFGRQLITSLDLDPVYVGLNGAGLDADTRDRWLLAYWCCYDVGVSCWVAEGSSFWNRLWLVARNVEPAPIGGRFRRAAERRHWRGRNALESVANLEDRYRQHPEHMARYCAHGGLPGQASFATQTSCREVMKRAREHVGFGPWIAFKVADMAERCMGASVSFREAEVFLFDAPREGALMAHARGWGHPLDEEEAVRRVVGHLLDRLGGLNAPPALDRPIGLQEVETVLCKWKSHVNGHYPVGKDLHEVRHHLEPWAGVSDLARRFLEALPCALPAATGEPEPEPRGGEAVKPCAHETVERQTDPEHEDVA